ncbi:MAG: hypothetical protein AB1649_26540 [Chloroflexota bacterium]
MKKMILLAALLLAACAPQAPEVALPQFIATATPYIDPSYPTAQANVAFQSQTASGIDIRMDSVWQDGKNINANICFTMPDASDWSIWAASLNYGGTVLDIYGTTLMSLQEGANGQAGQRCDTLTFVVPPDADLSNASIVVNAIGAYPSDDDYCSLLMPKIQQAMVERGTGIVVECLDSSGTGALTMQITSKPAEMTQEQAEMVVYSDEFYTIPGPWTFPFNLVQ